MQSTIRFIIVVYRPDKKVLKALTDALAGQQVMVVDNTKKNLGYGGAANRGMKTAFDAGAQWVVVINQDIKLTKMGITHLCAIVQQCDAGIVGPWAGTLDSKRWTTILNNNETKFHGEHEYISGTFMAIHRQVWEMLGGFYEPYFMYYEDVDYCIRARRGGFHLIYRPIDGIKHDDNLSLGKGSFLHEYYLARNHLLFVERQAPLSVKLYEYLRLPIAFGEAMYNKGKRSGLTDFFFRKFGPY